MADGSELGDHTHMLIKNHPQVTHSLRWLYNCAAQGDRWPENLDGCCMLLWHYHKQHPDFYIGCTCFQRLNDFPKTDVILQFVVAGCRLHNHAGRRHADEGSAAACSTKQ